MDHNFSPLVNRFESAAVMLLNVENDEPGHKDRPSVPHFSDFCDTYELSGILH